jgi:hypothetical protein
MKINSYEIIERAQASTWALQEQLERHLADVRTEIEREAMSDATDLVLEACGKLLRLTRGQKMSTEAFLGVRRDLQEVIARRALPANISRALAVLRVQLGPLTVFPDEPQPGAEGEGVQAPGIYVPAALLHQIHEGIHPAERMFVGSARNHGSDMRVIESAFDVTGAATATHVVPDGKRLAAALMRMSRTNSYFGFWAHSHPGGSLGSTHPSHEDHSSYRKRRERGASEWLLGAIFAGAYVRFWGDRSNQVVVTGEGCECIDEEGQVYELAG